MSALTDILAGFGFFLILISFFTIVIFWILTGELLGSFFFDIGIRMIIGLSILLGIPAGVFWHIDKSCRSEGEQ